MASSILFGKLSMAISLRFLFGDVGMEVVSKEVSALHSTMTIEDTEVGRLLPIVDMLWLREIQYDGNSIFVVLSYWSLIGGGGVRAYGPVAIFGVFGWFKIGNGHHNFG
jgi:hypothetical protein